MTQVHAVLLVMTAACIATGVALHRQKALGTGGLLLVTLVALVIAAAMIFAQ